MTDKNLTAIPAQAVGISDEVMEVIKIIGRIEMADFMLTVSQRSLVESYIKLKESGDWKKVSADCQQFDDFCHRFFRRSRKRCEELARNYHLLGPELYEQAEAIGLGQRDYNALKALPADDQQIVKQAIESEDRSRIIDLLQEMAVKHGKEKESSQRRQDELAAQVAKTQAELDAKDRNIKKKSEEISDLKDKLDDKKARLAEDPQRVALEGYIKDMFDDAIKAHAAVSAGLRMRCLAVFDAHDAGHHDGHARIVVAQALGLVAAAVHHLARDLDINPSELPETTLDEAMHGEGAAVWRLVDKELAGREDGRG